MTARDVTMTTRDVAMTPRDVTSDVTMTTCDVTMTTRLSEYCCHVTQNVDAIISRAVLQKQDQDLEGGNSAATLGLERHPCLPMELLNALTLELCDTYLCCNQWYTNDKPPDSPPLALDALDETNEIIVEGSDGAFLSKHSSVDPGGGEVFLEAGRKANSWEECDIRRPDNKRPTLKELAEEHMAAQRAIRILRESQGDKQSIVDLRKQGSVITTDGDDESIDLRSPRGSSQCSELSNTYHSYNQRSREISFDESDKEANLVVRPSSKLETDSKDSGYGPEINGCSKRKLVRYPTTESKESMSPHPSPNPGYESNVNSEANARLMRRSQSERGAGTPTCLASEPPCTPNTTPASRSKKNSIFSSFRRSKQESSKDSEEERSSSSKKKRKKKNERSKSSVSVKPSFVLRGKRSPGERDGNCRVPLHNVSYESEDI